MGKKFEIDAETDLLSDFSVLISGLISTEFAPSNVIKITFA